MCPCLSVSIGSPPVHANLEAGLAHHRAGRLDDARANYERVLAIDPCDARALDLLGMVHIVQGRAEEGLACFQRAVESAPDFPPALNHLGLALKNAGRVDEALAVFHHAVAVAPGFAEAQTNLGNALLERGNADEAIACFREALRAAPDFEMAHNSLGGALFRIGHMDAAMDAFGRAIALAPNYAHAWHNVGGVLTDQERFEEAIEAYERALAIQPGRAETHNGLGHALSLAGRYEEAAARFEAACALDPDHAEAQLRLGIALARSGHPELANEHVAEAIELARAAIERAPDDWKAWEILGTALLRTGRSEDAFAARARATAIKRRPGASSFAGLQTFRQTTRGRIDHDIEQIWHLAAQGVITDPSILEGYETVVARIPVSAGDNEIIELDQECRRAIGASYNRLWHVASAPEIVGGAVNPALDRTEIEADYTGRAPGITWVDDFLTTEALASLRRFCLESTVWFRSDYTNGYLGAFAEDGFTCPLLLQIGRELPRHLPGLFGDLPLLKVWAFKYGERRDGIGLHADFAAVNVNFWITPGDANLAPESGGLLVWDKEAPAEWDFRTYNVDHEAMRRFLAESGAKPHRIPRRQNRAVIFNSDLIHATDTIRFKPGYENRRINITFLYGERTGRI
ncbi:MAG TPA: tetratricopeptide repeat protein [Alphaproteobacteria bacterium]|nr:tetratricopeptide repeat protein [Alphaproteobacteria bacterium]